MKALAVIAIAIIVCYLCTISKTFLYIYHTIAIAFSLLVIFWCIEGIIKMFSSKG